MHFTLFFHTYIRIHALFKMFLYIGILIVMNVKQFCSIVLIMIECDRLSIGK